MTTAAIERQRQQDIVTRSVELLTDMGLNRMRRMNEQDRNSYLAMIGHIAERLVDGDASLRQLDLSEHYLWLLDRRASSVNRIRQLDARVQDLENWLDIYQHPIENMWNPDEVSSVDGDDEDMDDDESVADVSAHEVSTSESEAEVEPAAARGARERHGPQQRRGSDHDENHSDGSVGTE